LDEKQRGGTVPLTDRLSVGRRSSQRCVERSNQLPDTSTTKRCARVAPQDVYYDGRRKDPGLRDLVESDGGIVSGGELERACGMSGRSEDVLDLSSFRQWVEERRTHRIAGRPRSVARSRLSRIARFLSRPVCCPRDFDHGRFEDVRRFVKDVSARSLRHYDTLPGSGLDSAEPRL
jgi:hypothetical protein